MTYSRVLLPDGNLKVLFGLKGGLKGMSNGWRSFPSYILLGFLKCCGKNLIRNAVEIYRDNCSWADP